MGGDLSRGLVLQARVGSSPVVGAAILLDEDRGFVDGEERDWAKVRDGFLGARSPGAPASARDDLLMVPCGS